jgi:hypothetical protein
MDIDIPAEVLGHGLAQGRHAAGRVNRHVMLKAFFTDIGQQSLQVGHMNDAVTAERLKRVVGQVALAQVNLDFAGEVIGGNPAVGAEIGVFMRSQAEIGRALAVMAQT